MHRHQLVMKRGSRQTQQLTLTADRELRVVMIDQFSQLTGIRAVEILFQSLELHSELANQLEQLRPRPFAWCKSRGPNALIRG